MDNNTDICTIKPSFHLGISAIRWFPKTAHLLLSCSMDSKIKLWEVYNRRRLVQTFSGHKQAVRDVSFNNDGTQFLSASYDRFNDTVSPRYKGPKINGNL